jgi:hypothetical protein
MHILQKTDLPYLHEYKAVYFHICHLKIGSPCNHKVKHILCSYFPEIGRMWRAVLLYAELSLYLGSCGNYVLFFTSLNCLCHLMCMYVRQLKACVVMAMYLVFQVFCKTCTASTFVIHVIVYCRIKCSEIVCPLPPHHTLSFSHTLSPPPKKKLSEA